MWNIVKRSAENYMSLEDFEEDFRLGCTVIKGINKDDKGQKSNGACKSGYIDIVPIALTGISLAGRPLKDCVNWNGDKSYFKISITLSHSNGDICEISRKVYGNTRSAELVIKVNGKRPEGLPSKQGVEDGVDIKAGNEYIYSGILGISKEDLFNHYLIADGYYTSYMKSSSDRQVKIIGRFSKSNKIDKVIEWVSAEERKYLSQWERAEAEINSFEVSLVSEEYDLEAQSATEFGEVQKRQIEKYKFDKKMANDNITQTQISIDVNNEEWSRINSQVENAPDNSGELLDELSTLEVELLDSKVKIQKQVRDVRAFIKELDIILMGEIECPKCKHRFVVGDKEVNLEETKEGLEGAKKLLKEAEEAEATKQKSIDETNELRREVEKNILTIQGWNTQLQIIENKNRGLESSIATQRQLIIDCDTAIGTVESWSLEEKVLGIKKNIEGFKKAINDKKSEMKKLATEKKKVDQWLKNFTDFKFFLVNKPIKAICGHINYYLKQNNSDLSVLIEGFKKLKNGELRQKFNPIIFRNGTNGKEYPSFSGGEKTRIGLATDLAFQSIVNSISPTGGLNYYQNDELLNPLDSEGIVNAAEAFDQLGKVILLVTHSGADMTYKNVVTLEKLNSVTRIK